MSYEWCLSIFHTPGHTHTPMIRGKYGVNLVLTPINLFIEWAELLGCINKEEYGFLLLALPSATRPSLYGFLVTFENVKVYPDLKHKTIIHPRM